MPEGEGFISRVLHKLGGRPSQDSAPTLEGTPAPDQSAPQDPALGRANILDQANRSIGLRPNMGGAMGSTPPTAEGLARAQEAVASTQPTPPTPGTTTQGS